MNLSIFIKTCLANIFEYSGLIKYNILEKSKCNYLILMYHRILPKDLVGPGIQAGMYVEPETFDMHIGYLKKYFRIVSLSELYISLKGEKYIENSFPICSLTFDDGWYDVFEFAYPILRENRVPATVFLPTNYIGTDKIFWTDQLTNIFLRNKNPRNKSYRKNISKSCLAKKIESLDGPTELKIERAISILKNYTEDDVFNVLKELEVEFDVVKKSQDRSFLRWEEVKCMLESGFITFGSHTNNHKILTHLDDKIILNELIQSKNRLLCEEVIDPSFISLSYPNGNYDNRVINILGDAGYHAAVTTEMGWNHNSTSCFALKRVSIHQDMSSTKEMFGCRIANLY